MTYAIVVVDAAFSARSLKESDALRRRTTASVMTQGTVFTAPCVLFGSACPPRDYGISVSSVVVSPSSMVTGTQMLRSAVLGPVMLKSSVYCQPDSVYT